jgi:hypothetical protein
VVDGAAPNGLSPERARPSRPQTTEGAPSGAFRSVATEQHLVVDPLVGGRDLQLGRQVAERLHHAGVEVGAGAFDQLEDGLIW